MFVEAILAEEETAHETLPILIEIAAPEVSCTFLGDPAGASSAPLTIRSATDGDSLPLQLVLNPPQIFGQVEALTPEEMAEFHKEFSHYDAESQLANVDPIRNVLTPTVCRGTCSYVTCGIDVPSYDDVHDDRINGL